jgi:phosphoribosylaminoimidazolecarboxamide formyltransferase/IMP cyclohydrolase
VKRALISVFDKQNLENVVSYLNKIDIEIISSGGTKDAIENLGIQTRAVSEVTGFPEILDGRVKTLHPAIFSGILAKRSAEHLDQLEQHHLSLIDFVIVNLYPFESTIAKSDCTLEEAIEKIDIGGPSLVRAAAKNFKYTTVITSSEQYEELIAELEAHKGETSEKFRHQCALKAFQHVARYNTIIADYLQNILDEKTTFANEFTLQGKKLQDLRYGENPHQKAAFYACKDYNPLNNFKQYHGKELSYNNILDLDAALAVVTEFDDPTTVIIKHNNPCGAARDSSLVISYKNALATDPSSAFGGIVGLNRKVDGELANQLKNHFFECILAPEFSEDALKTLTKKKNLRILTYVNSNKYKPQIYLKTVAGGFLIQEADISLIDIRQAKVVSKRAPSEEEWRSLEFAWRLVKHVKSNAIIFAADNRLIGIGAGQMSRVDAAELAKFKAEKAQHSTKNTVVASDAFFPFKDGIEVIAKAGATAIIQPGGSVRDEEVIEAADTQNLALIFTGMRHFRH